jgi:hypothetical protein
VLKIKYLRNHCIIFYCRPKVIETDYLIPFIAQTKNSSAKIAIFSDSDCIASKFCFNETFILLEQVLLTSQEGFLFGQNHFIFQLTDKIVGELLPSGILQHSRDYHWFFAESKETPEELGPQVLRVTDLSFGFVLWLAACGISTAVFVVEWLIPRVKQFIRTSIGLIIFLKLLRQHLNIVY